MLEGLVQFLAAAFNSGLLVEKLGNRRFLMLGVLAFLLDVGTLSLKLPFVIVLIMLLPLGFGVAIIDAGLNAYIITFWFLVCSSLSGRMEWPNRLEIAVREQHICAECEGFWREDIEVEGISNAVNDVEVGADIEGIQDGLFAYACCMERCDIFWPDISGGKSHFFQEAQRGSQFFVDGGGTPINQDGLNGVVCEFF